MNATPKPFPSPASSDAPGIPEIELELQRIWQRTLGLARVSVNDGFFDLGGDSLKAVAMLEDVETLMGTRLPSSILLQHSSIAALAREIRRRPGLRSWSALVALNERGSRTPIVAVHGAGDVLHYARLAEALGEDQPFIALQALQEDDGKHFASIEEIASAYIDEVKRARPEGPYILAGNCVGSVIALEMAQQLLRRGERIDTVVFFDTAPGRQRKKLQYLKRRLRRVAYLAGRIPVHLGRGTLITKAMEWIGRVSAGSNETPPKPGSSRRMLYSKLVKQYRHRRFPGRVVLVQTEGYANNPKLAYHARNARRLAGRGFEMIVGPGSHLEQFKPPHVQIMAARLADVLATYKS